MNERSLLPLTGLLFILYLSFLGSFGGQLSYISTATLNKFFQESFATLLVMANFN
jgi:hypothetical protein